MDMPKTPILILGATSRTGFAAVKSLLASSSHSDLLIIAVSRDVTSPRSINLAALSPAIRMIQGDLKNCAAIFNDASAAINHQPIHGLFSNAHNMRPGWTAEQEIQEARSIIDQAAAHGISHFVLASIDRGLPPSFDAPQLPAHFATKQVIEDHLIATTARHPSMSHTILRTTCIMENLGPNLHGRAFATWWKGQLTYTKPLALVSTVDVGHLAAQSFLKWCYPAFHNQALTLAGDHLTFAHACRICKQRRGYDLPCVPELVARVLGRDSALTEQVLAWCDLLGFSSDVPALRRLHPGLLGFGDWLERESDYSDKRK